MTAQMRCYYSIAPSTYKSDISASAICHFNLVVSSSGLSLIDKEV